jgi:hypothetical protein
MLMHCRLDLKTHAQRREAMVAELRQTALQFSEPDVMSVRSLSEDLRRNLASLRDSHAHVTRCEENVRSLMRRMDRALKRESDERTSRGGARHAVVSHDNDPTTYRPPVHSRHTHTHTHTNTRPPEPIPATRKYASYSTSATTTTNKENESPWQYLAASDRRQREVYEESVKHVK